MRSSAYTGTAIWLLLFAASPCLAQERPNTLEMSCKAAAGLVARQGAIVLGTGSSTFDRYVASRSFCTVDDIIQPGFVPTVDNPNCFIGYYCAPRDTKDVH